MYYTTYYVNIVKALYVITCIFNIYLINDVCTNDVMMCHVVL